MLQKLYYIYGLDTACLYTDEENEIEKKIIKARFIKNKLKKKYALSILQKGHKAKTWQFINHFIIDNKEKLKRLLHQNLNLVRTVRHEKIYNSNGESSIKRRISIFDSQLTRCLEMKERELNTEIVIIKVYFFDVAESIVKHGFYMDGHKYKFFSASAGQIRTKRLVAVREDLLNDVWNTLTAGLSIEKINAQGGMNINKYLAYLALCNSATDKWEEFDIDRCIVVDDFENIINDTVDYIDEKTYEIKRVKQDLPFVQTDGVGMILPCLTDRNFMTRLPFVKGLLAKFDYLRFINENNASPVVKDIYGDEHNIIEENIQIIFTKSQFKMSKFFKNWQEYKDNFKKYHCTAGKCKIEEDYIPDSTINYQMIQSLHDLTDDEIIELSKKNVKTIKELTTDVKTMLKVFGATEWNTNKTGFQKSLLLYPELLSDLYMRTSLRDIKNKLEKELWSAKFDIGAKYTFVIPDLYAFCEWLFLHIKNPNGLLDNGEVCCKLYDDGKYLDCLRSPHLYCEHPIRLNKTKNDWFNTKAIYISSKDLISRIIQCDFDGDTLLVSDNSTLVNAAQRNMKSIVPLFYNMGKAGAEILSPETLYKGLTLAYTGGNIGAPSNDITKIWNSGKIEDEQLNVIKWLCAEVNYIIDYSKTLYKPQRPDFANDIVTKYTKSKVPFFFMYAKQKEKKQVEPISNCCVDRISQLFVKQNLNFNFKSSSIGKFNYKILMNNPEIAINQDIINFYKKICSKLPFNNIEDNKMCNYIAVYDDARKKIVEFALEKGYNEIELVDNLVFYLFNGHKSANKKAFWSLFGDVVACNIENNVKNLVRCQRCHKRFVPTRSTQIYCSKCQGYQKQGTKTLMCIDCGKEFVVDARNMKKIRCDNCQKIYRKKYKNLKEIERYHRKQ